MMHKIAVLACHSVLPFDLGIPCEVFARAETADGRPAYRLQVCGPARTIKAGVFDIRVPFGLDCIAEADTVIIPGISDIERVGPVEVLNAIRSAWDRGARLASICSGAFVLAAAGLLNGRRATTHWRATAELARLYPSVRVEPDVLFVDEGRIITSAGASAGLDMCLHLLRRDHGQAVAALAARLAVAPLHRDGGQAQFIQQELPRSEASLAPLLDWMLANLHRPHSVNSLAARARMSPRTFARRFRDQTGTTPLQWLLSARVRRAQELLETTGTAVDQVATATGFDSPVTFRARFKGLVGVSPAAYRRRFNCAASG